MDWTLDIIEVGVIPDLPWNIYLPSAAPEARLDVPCYCYLLTRPGSCLLIDTGPDRERSARADFAIVGNALPALERALDRRHRTMDDVESIIHTHLHYDHIQNDGLFPRAEIIVQRREFEWARSQEADRFYVDIDAFHDECGSRITLVDGEREVHKGLTLVPNGGHTPGHQSIIVQTREGPVCVCGDILPMLANTKVLPPSQDPAATQAFIARTSSASWEILPGHDPAQRTHRWSVPSS